MSVDTQTPSTALSATAAARVLPETIVIPPIRGEMLRLQPATQDDLPVLDEIDAYYNAPMITGKDQESERAMVHAWVARSEAWSLGRSPDSRAGGDPQSRGTIAWSILTGVSIRGDDSEDAGASQGSVMAEANSAKQNEHQSATVEHRDSTDNEGRRAYQDSDDGCRIIGMIFLIDIDPWASSARIQVILGRDYRGRGYSRDAMPRVMTYGFAPAPVGLNLHRIWVAVPSINTRSLSVYTSLGFVQSGAARDGMWDARSGKYQDLIVMDTLVDEYDPLGSLEAFGMHVFEENPGVAQALAAHVPQQTKERDINTTDQRGSHDGQTPAQDGSGTEDAHQHEAPGATGVWPTTPSEANHSKRAWWRNLGREPADTPDSQTRSEEQQS